MPLPRPRRFRPAPYGSSFGLSRVKKHRGGPRIKKSAGAFPLMKRPSHTWDSKSTGFFTEPFAAITYAKALDA